MGFHHTALATRDLRATHTFYVEFCTTTAVLTAADREQALRLLSDPKPPFEDVPDVIVHQPSERRAAAAS